MSEPATGADSSRPASTPSTPSLSAADFLLGAEAFVERCIAAYADDPSELSAGERAALADAIRAGRPRIEVVEVVRRRFSPLQFPAERPKVSGIAGHWSQFVVSDLLERFAPDDDEAFVRQVYAQTLDRSPSPIDVLEATFDLKSGSISRSELIQRLAARSPACRTSADKLATNSGALAAAWAKMSPEGMFQFRMIEFDRAGGWSVAPDMWLQPTQTIDGALKLNEGWVLLGPKRSFPAGSWQLVIDLIQPARANLVIDVVANSGLDVLVKLDLTGPAQLAVPFTIQPWHNFIEVRLMKPAEEESYRWLKPRQLELRQA
jgi:hypothetical protein